MRRIARLVISPEILLTMSRGRYEIIRDPLPADARLVQVTIEPLSGCIHLFLESQEFAECPEGYMPVQLPSPVIRQVDYGESGTMEGGGSA